MNRRSFLKTTALTAAAIPFASLGHRTLSAQPTEGYGRLIPTTDQTTGLPLLSLPHGFAYLTLVWSHDRMDDGRRVPRKPDGMAAFAFGSGRVRIVRSHELGPGTPFSTAVYNPAAGGGTTTLEFDTDRGALVSMHASLSGTMRNCGGGRTPWGSFVTCEETTALHEDVPHGYNFEVPVDGLADPTPLRGMGRFAHEAIAVDPATGYVYETEDAGNSGFYRFVPRTPGALRDGGELFGLKVRSKNRADLGVDLNNGDTFDVEWVPIAEPDRGGIIENDFVWRQGRNEGAARFDRLEGCAYGKDGRIYFASTTGGIGQGQIWRYDPDAETVSVLFQSPRASVLNAPDTICVSPKGSLVVCEDGSGDDYLQGLTMNGEIFRFAKNSVILDGERNGLVGDYRTSEWSGACFSPDGKWLFANIMDPGIMFAITGPWESGPL